MIELDGSQAGAGVDGLKLTGGVSVVSGLVIHAFSGDGVEFGSGASGSSITGSYIGTDVTGAVAGSGNQETGVLVTDSSSNTIGGAAPEARNLISGNDLYGVRITGAGASGNQVLGNLIGTDVAGAAGLGNGQDGLVIWDAPGNTISSAQPGQGTSSQPTRHME